MSRKAGNITKRRQTRKSRTKQQSGPNTSTPVKYRFVNSTKSLRQWMRDATASITPGPDEQLSPWLRPGSWFWVAIFIGLAIRIYFVGFTEGTSDTQIWQRLAGQIQKVGLIESYRSGPDMNHPPVIGVIMSWLLSIADVTGIAFRILLRAPFALLDGCTAILLIYIFRTSRYRFVIAACYWLCPLTMIFSAYHGNTDSSIAFFLLLCTCLISKEKIVWAGAVIGVSLWIKLPGVLAVPAFVFFIPRWRKRLIFLSAFAVAGALGYLPILIKSPNVIFTNVLGYKGQPIHTMAGVLVWGPLVFYKYFKGISTSLWDTLYHVNVFWMIHDKWICILSIVLLCWLRRSEKTLQGLGLTIAGVYTILYGFSNYWSFQYFAWSIPFWFFARKHFTGLAMLLGSIYIYAVYWFVCGNPWLLGKWDFEGHHYWPNYLERLRDIAMLFFFSSAWIFLISGIFGEIKRQFLGLGGSVAASKN